MLNNIDLYQDCFDMPKLAEKQHPENIYLEPISKWTVYAVFLPITYSLFEISIFLLKAEVIKKD